MGTTSTDPEQIERAKKNLKPEFKDRIEFKVADAMSLNEPAESFDAVFAFGVLHHLEDWRKGIKEISRVLKRDGEFFFEEILKAFLKNFLLRNLTEHSEGGQFDYEEFKKELDKNNIRISSVKHLSNAGIFGVGRKQ